MKSFLHIPVDADNEKQLRGVYAVLASPIALAAALAVIEGNASSTAGEKISLTATTGSPVSPTPANSTAETADKASGGDAGEIDSHGHPWSEELHVGTKGKTKEGLWRMKPGVSRPDPLPGFPKDDAGGNGGTGTKSDGAASDAGASASAATAGPATEVDEDDEFAAFREAAAAGGSGAAARSWSDADLSSLANQAAQALGGPDDVKALIAKYVPEGQIARSSNIPVDQREAFASELEKTAGIEFAG